MIVAFEGAPGVGKSTVAAALSGAAAVVPEVNRLFRRTPNSSQLWYLDRQVARCEMAALAAEEGQLAILDGDPLQPVWFGWIYPDENWVTPAEALAHFAEHAREGGLWLPDRYLLFTLDEETWSARLFARERLRGSGEQRARTKVARYLAMARAQSRYFAALESAFPRWIKRIEPRAQPADVAAMITAMPARSAPPACDAIAFLGQWFAS